LRERFTVFAKSSLVYCRLYFLTSTETTRGFNLSRVCVDTVISLLSEGDVLAIWELQPATFLEVTAMF